VKAVEAVGRVQKEQLATANFRAPIDFVSMDRDIDAGVIQENSCVCELADAVVEGVGDEEVVVAVHRHPDGEIQAGACSRAAVTAEARTATARYRADGGSARCQHGKECGIKGKEKDECTRGENQTNQ